MGNRLYLKVIVLSVVLLFACGCGGSGETSDILTEVPTGTFTGSLGSGDLAGAWHLWMLSTSGGQMREYYFIAEQTSPTTAIAFLTGPMGMTWVEIAANGSTYSFTVSEYWPREDFESQYVYTGTRSADSVTGNFVGDAKDNFFTSNAGHFTGTFKADIIPLGADFMTPTTGATGTMNGALGYGLTDIEIAGEISFEISGYDVEGTMTFDILDDYGAPPGVLLDGVPFSGTLAGADYNEFNCDFTIDQDGWTGNGSIVGYMADVQPTSAIWTYTFMSNGKFTLSNITGHGHTNWAFRGGWSAVGN